MNLIEKLDKAGLFGSYFLPLMVNILLAIAIFLIGRAVIGILIKIIRKVLANTDYDPMIVNFMISILHTVLLLFVVVASLDQLGVNTTSLVAILGAAGLAIGLSLKDSLQNFAAGVLLLVFRPFRAGDYIEAGGTTGTVCNITIFSTILSSPDNKEVTVPNGSIYKSNIVNHTARGTRRVDMIFNISYDSDLKKAKQIIADLLASDNRVLDDPAPVIAVAALAQNSVDLIAKPWVETNDLWTFRPDMIEAVKIQFDRQGIDIPFPQMSVHLPESTRE